jgi:hypothetical protein
VPIRRRGERSSEVIVRPVSIIVLGSAVLACGIACHSAEPARRKSAAELFIVPKATEVRYTDDYEGGLTYRVVDPYPAERTLGTIKDTLLSRGWTPMRESLLSPSQPSSHVVGWQHYFDATDSRDVQQWLGSWTDRRGSVATYRLTYRAGEGSARPEVVEVSASLMAPDTVSALRKWAEGHPTPSPGVRGGPPSQLPSDTYQHQTCAVCGSTRQRHNGGPWRVTYASTGFETCGHKWQDGVSLADKDPVQDGRVVLLKRLDPDSGRWAYGAFVLRRQRADPAQFDYVWYLRVDGSGRLDAPQPTVRDGQAAAQTAIVFGPFRVHWSAARDGAGFVYYGRMPGDPVEPGTTFYCATNVTNIAGLDAASAKWRYKSSVVN